MLVSQGSLVVSGDLNVNEPAPLPKKSRSLDSLSAAELAEAKRRFAIIKSLVRCSRRTDEDVRKVVDQHGVSRTSLYRWLKAYEGRRLLTDLAPRRRGRTMPKHLEFGVEAVIAAVVKDIYLTKQKASAEEVVVEVHRRCRALSLAKPSAGTIRARLRAISPKEKLLKREGRKAAHDRFGAVKQEFPGADVPLSVIQIDHTMLDIIVLDEEMRLPIGRPWLTLAIDVFSRMVFGYHLSLADMTGFCDAILRSLKAPYRSARAPAKWDHLLQLLTAVGTRLLILDEVNNLLIGKVDQRAMVLNALKSLSNELRIPVVAMGTQDAVRVFQTDPQLGNRFEPMSVPRWTVSREYAVFVGRFVQGLELQNESEFKTRDIVTRVHTMAEGLTGETCKLLTMAAEMAVRNGREMVDMATLDEVPWVVPSERRRVAK